MIIGLCGYTGVGKDTIAQYLVDKYDFTRVAFADAMREDLYKLNPIIVWGMNPIRIRLREIVDEMGWDEAKRTYPEIRRLLQVYGTEVGRDGFGESIWLDRALKKIRAAKGGVVITDIRFQNELSFLRMLNTYRDGLAIVHVTRPGHGAINGHASEQLDYSAICDYTISNSGSVDDLHSAIEEQIACVVK